MLPLHPVEAENPSQLFRPHVAGAEPEGTVGGLDDTVVIDTATQPGIEFQGPGRHFRPGKPGHRGLLVVSAHRPQRSILRHHEPLGMEHQSILCVEARPSFAVEAHQHAVPAHEPEIAIGSLSRKIQPLIGCPAGGAVVQAHRLPSQRRHPQRAVGRFQ